MASSTTFVIVGGGLAGAKAAEALRDKDFDGRIVLFGDEEHLPYERPPLSKEYLAGKKSLERVHRARLRLVPGPRRRLAAGHRVTVAGPAGAHRRVCPTARRSTTTSCCWRPDRASRRLPMPGADAAGVHYLRTFDDADALNSRSDRRERAGRGRRRLDRAGGGRRRPRSAASTSPSSRRAERRCWPRSARESARCSPTCTASTGWTCGSRPRSRRSPPAGRRRPGCKLADGSTVAADAVLVAVGAKPNIELAEQAGLSIGDGGVLVDASLRTSDPDIYAVGDIAAAEHPLFGARIRAEHWANALKQPAVAAAGDARAGRRRTTSCPTSSPTSTTSAWSTSGTPPELRPGGVPRRRRRP